MNGIGRRLQDLEKRAGAGEPITINIHKTIIGMDGEPERPESREIRLGEGA